MTSLLNRRNLRVDAGDTQDCGDGGLITRGKNQRNMIQSTVIKFMCSGLLLSHELQQDLATPAM